MCLVPRRPAPKPVVVRPSETARDEPTMTTVELVCRCVLQLLLAACAAMLCVRLCTGCAYVKAMHEEAKPAAVVLLKEAYANGGAAAVSNRIEKLVADGKVSPDQAARLHVLARCAVEALLRRAAEGEARAEGAQAAARVFDGVVDRLETDPLDAALTPTNAPAIL